MQEKDKRPLTDEAYDIIKMRIIDLHYRPGEVLFTQQLAQELNLSRTPVREALVKLSQEGLLGQTDSRKFQVTDITKESIVEIYSLRECFELAAVGHVIAHIDRNDIEAMQSIINRMNESLKKGDADMFFSLDNEFHSYLIRKYNNRFLINFVNQLTDHQQRIRYVTFFVSNRMNSTISEHQHILECLKSKDLSEASSAIKAHLSNAESEVLSFMDSKDFRFLNSMQTIKR